MKSIKKAKRKAIKEDMNDSNIDTISSVKQTKGRIFKEKHGYSKTMYRLMLKYNCKTVEEYREIRRKNRKNKK